MCRAAVGDEQNLGHSAPPPPPHAFRTTTPGLVVLKLGNKKKHLLTQELSLPLSTMTPVD